MDHALRMAEEGADFIDVGGESTRPNAEPVAEEGRIASRAPVIERLRGRLAVPSPSTHENRLSPAPLYAGASLVNDIEANREDPRMAGGRRSRRGLRRHAHARESADDANQPGVWPCGRRSAGVLRGPIGEAGGCGSARDHVILDVGIGFGKTVEHNLELPARLNSFTRFERPLLLGVSRKSFLGKLFGADVGARLPAGLACASWAVEAGVQIIRTHDVAPTRQAVHMIENILNCRK